MFKLQIKDNPKRSIWLVGEKVTLGSDGGNTFVLDGLGIDDFHAQLLIRPDHLILKSKSGSCIVNDLPVDDGHRLTAGDELRIGRERLLIIDPQMQKASQAQVEAPVKPARSADWTLIPDHPKLKELDFSIHGKAVLGRSKDCALAVPYKMLSREHAELRVEGDELFLRDLGSANGCFVNGNRVQEAKLNDGDKVAFAKLVFTVKAANQAKPVAERQQKPKNDSELNRTVIRPAINLEAELAAREASEASNSIQLELEPTSSAESASGGEPETSTGTNKMLVVLAIVVVAVSLGGAWFFLTAI